MGIDVEAVEIEGMLWKPTGELRWFRSAGRDDTEKVLQQLYERVTGERTWRVVPTLLED